MTKHLQKLIDEILPDTIENFDNRNQLIDQFERLKEELKIERLVSKDLKKQVDYFENRFPEFMLEGADYQEEFYPYHYS